MTHYALLAPPVLLILAGCSSAGLSGMPGATDRLSCPLSEGVTCKSMSQVYEESVLGQRPKDTPPASIPAAAEGPPPSRRLAVATRVPLPVAPAGDPMPLRSRPNTLRLWVAPWQDADGDLHEDGWLDMRLDNGEWMVDHVRARVRDEFAALKPPPNPLPAEPREDGKPAAGATGLDLPIGDRSLHIPDPEPAAPFIPTH